jgi:hypothetical protein
VRIIFELTSHLSKHVFSKFSYIFNTAKAKTAGKDEKPEKKTRKKRDIDAPKKPMSAFFWYQQSRRSVLKAEQPEMSHKDTIKVCISIFLFPLFIFQNLLFSCIFTGLLN